MGHGSNSDPRGAFCPGGGVERRFQAEATVVRSLKGRWSGPLVFVPRFGLGLRRQNGLVTID